MSLATAFSETLDKEKWINETIDKINTLWKRSVDDVLEACKLLAEAKELLGGNEKKKEKRHLWEHFLANDELKLTQRTIEKLTKIGNWKYITDPSVTCKLPPAWSTIYELVVWSEDKESAFLRAIKNNDVKCDMERKDVSDLKGSGSSGKDLNTKRIVSIEVNADDYASWDVVKLGEVKSALEKNLKAVENKLSISVNTSTLDEKIKAIEDKKVKNELNKGKDELIVVTKLQKMVDKKLETSTSLLQEYKGMSEVDKVNEIQKDFHTPKTISNYIKVLHSNWKISTDVLSKGKVFTGVFDESYFDKELEAVGK